jgi:hypothetical protein
MDTFKKVIYEQNKQFLENIMGDFISEDSDDKEKNKFMEKYHKLNFTYMIPNKDEVEKLHKIKFKRIMK